MNSIREDRGKMKPVELDPNGILPHDPGAKLDKGKPRAGLIEDFSLALMAVTEVLDFGARKYSPHGWESVPDGEERYRDAAWRHLLARRHEQIDPDSGLDHDQQVVWNFLAALELKLRKIKKAQNNKPYTPKNAQNRGKVERTA